MTRLAVVGATGLVGTKILETIDVNISNLMSWYYSHQQDQQVKKLSFKENIYSSRTYRRSSK